MTIFTIEPCQICKGTVKYEDGREYEGEIFNAVPHGKGMLKIKEWHGYAGTFFYGEPKGYGVWTRPYGKTAYGVWDKSGEFKFIKGGEWK